MSKITVKVANKRRKKKRTIPFAKAGGKVFGAVRAVLMRPRLTMLGVFVGGVLTFGTPHIGWDYRCSHPMQGHGTCRSASWCAYYGIQGRRIDIPETGQTCSPVKLITINWNRVMKGLTDGE